MVKNYIISVDFGGTKILAALINPKGKIIARSKTVTQPDSGKAGMFKALVLTIKNVLAEGEVEEGSVKAICVGIPGSVNPYTGIIGSAPNLKISNFNFREVLAKHFSIPILIENDVNLGALGILRYELKKEGTNVLVVFVGTGIGGALIFDRKLYRGTNYFAGEIGHMVIQPNGPLCGCGKHGCFEALASRLAIVRDIRKDLKKKKRGVLKHFAIGNKPIKSKALALAIKKLDPIAVKNVTKACVIIGQNLASITNLLNLDMIVLGGGVIEALGKFMLPKIKASFKDYVLKDAGREVQIIATALGDDAALYGGLALADEMEELTRKNNS
ncbi:MAG: ROK family protein [Ignavibacteriales bacterium]|nr:ROK family protein [Ignavibacteriales bacterium]